MGRAYKGGADTHRKPGEPHGAVWDAIRARMWRHWRAARRPCFHCGCPYETAPPNQVEHLISFQRAPWLAMEESNLAPTHGKCPPPPAGCGLACNSIAASNSAERDAMGRSVPFSEAFKRRKMTELAARGRQPGPGARNRRNPGETPAARPAAVGREW